MEFLVLHDVDSVISHVENTVHIEAVQEDEEPDVEGPDIGTVSLCFSALC